MVCGFQDYVSLYPDLSEVVLVIDSNKKFRLIDYNKVLGKPFSKFVCVCLVSQFHETRNEENFQRNC